MTKTRYSGKNLLDVIPLDSMPEQRMITDSYWIRGFVGRYTYDPVEKILYYVKGNDLIPKRPNSKSLFSWTLMKHGLTCYTYKHDELVNCLEPYTKADREFIHDLIIKQNRIDHNQPIEVSESIYALSITEKDTQFTKFNSLEEARDFAIQNITTQKTIKEYLVLLKETIIPEPIQTISAKILKG